MLRILNIWCVFTFCLFGCKGNPIAINQAVLENEFESQKASSSDSEKIQQLYSLFNESVLKETLSEFSLSTNLQKEDNPDKLPNVLAVQTSTDRLYTSKPNFEVGDEDNIEPTESKIIPQKLSVPFLVGQSITSQDQAKDTTGIPDEKLWNKLNTKSPLEYQSRRPTYASAPGGISEGCLGQLIPSGNPLPANPPGQNITIQDRGKETTTTAIPEMTTQEPTTKSPLEYQSRRPTYAGAPGGISGGHLGQLIPFGDPLPAASPTQNITIQDRIKDNSTTTIQQLTTQKPTTKSPLEYQSDRPTYAGAPGGISGGHLGQLIPFGDPLPVNPPLQSITIEDQVKETTTIAIPEMTTQEPTTKSPLEYQSRRPTYAGAPGGISGGHLGQLIPFGDPLPADPPTQNITIQDRIKENSTTTIQQLTTQNPTTKSPLEYQSHRPTYAGSPGSISGGHLGQLIPSGDPLPANLLLQNITIEDRVKETTKSTFQELPSQKPTTKSPLEYQPQRPSYAGAPGGISGGHLGQLIPSGIPLPANKPVHNITTEDKVKEPTTTTNQELSSNKPTTKLPWIFQPQWPTFAGISGDILGGHLGQLIPTRKPWPAGTETERPVLEDRFQETALTTTSSNTQELPSRKPSTKSPLEYQPQRPSFAGIPGGISGGHLGSLIPSGNPWPADKQTERPVLEDRLKETTTITPTTLQKLPSPKPSTQSPLEYQPQRPIFAGTPGGISGGHLGQLIPPGKPWPADFKPQIPFVEDRFKETTITSIQSTQSQQTTPKVSVGYKPHKPSYAGQLSSGYLGQLIPPGKPWPASRGMQDSANQQALFMK